MFSFNLVDQPWIPCRFPDDSRPVLLGLKETLARAHEIREIESGSPIVTASLHRLLLVILHRHFERGYGPVSADEWAALWKQGCFDETLVRDYLHNWRDRFDLFHPDRPFYQCASINKPEGERKPAALLSPELASGNNATLFDHSNSVEPAKFNASKAACSLVALQAFAAGGTVTAEKGQSSAAAAPLLNRGTVMVMGETLFETLLLNLLRYDPKQGDPIESGDDCPAWERDQEPDAASRAPTGYLDYLTWQSRRVRLYPSSTEQEPRVGTVLVMEGECFPKGWEQIHVEPMVASRSRKDRVEPVRFEPEKAIWRDSLALLSPFEQRSKRPRTIDWLGNLEYRGFIERPHRLRLSVVGLSPDFHFSFGSANHRVTSDAFIYAG